MLSVKGRAFAEQRRYLLGGFWIVIWIECLSGDFPKLGISG
jgi:hypothetical protein